MTHAQIQEYKAIYAKLLAMLNDPNITDAQMDEIERIDRQIYMDVVSSAHNEGINLNEITHSNN